MYNASSQRHGLATKGQPQNTLVGKPTKIIFSSARQLDSSQDLHDVGARSAPRSWEPIIRLRFGGLPDEGSPLQLHFRFVHPWQSNEHCPFLFWLANNPLKARSL